MKIDERVNRFAAFTEFETISDRYNYFESTTHSRGYLLVYPKSITFGSPENGRLAEAIDIEKRKRNRSKRRSPDLNSSMHQPSW